MSAVQETKTELREAKRQSDHESLRALEEEFYRCKSEMERFEERMKDLMYNKQVADFEEQQISHYQHPVEVELPRLEDQALEVGQTTEVAQYDRTPYPSNELVLYRPNDVTEVPAQDLSIQTYPENPTYPTGDYSRATHGSIFSYHDWDYSPDLHEHHSRFRGATGLKNVRKYDFGNGQFLTEWNF
ncbi:hypothetical protein CEP54_003919 [Fusarium duplospermum]|uniref:Uncharacterized protein n=1 Tax=Fusarium duplospermum TaxID=1325734 RepID=A0A428QLE3_9HYPO|nr:hypothetical protein CEP54_003919 [Fusarium duplospermum]